MASPCLAWVNRCTFAAPVNMAGWANWLLEARPSSLSKSRAQQIVPSSPKQIPKAREKRQPLPYSCGYHQGGSSE